MATKRALAKGQDWKRQQSCPVVRSSDIEARSQSAAGGAPLLLARKTAQSARPAVPKRTPLPAPRTEDCVYVREDEVHSPTTGRRLPLSGQHDAVKSTTLPSRATPASPGGQQPSATAKKTLKAAAEEGNHYYRTLSQDVVDENDDEDYDYSRFYSGPRGASASTLAGGRNGMANGQSTSPTSSTSSPYYRVLEAGQNGHTNTNGCATGSGGSDNEYDYTRFPMASTQAANSHGYSEIHAKAGSTNGHSPSHAANRRAAPGKGSAPNYASHRYSQIMDENGAPANSSDEDSSSYTDPRSVMGSGPPMFAAPSLPKSASAPNFQSPPGKPAPRPQIRKSPSSSTTSALSNGCTNGGRLSPKRAEYSNGRKLSPTSRPSVPPRKQSPLSARHRPTESVDGEEIYDEEYDYPTIERKAIPFFKSRPVSPKPGIYPHTSPTSPHRHSEEDGNYAYNEPLDSTSPFPATEHIYDSGMPPSRPRKISPAPKPGAAAKKPEVGGRPALPSKPGVKKPAAPPPGQSRPTLSKQEDVAAGNDDSDDDNDEYYDPASSMNMAARENEKNYNLLDGEPTPWYHATLSRVDADKLLTSHPRGTYLLRDGQKHEGYTLSVSRGSEQTRHFQVHALADGTYQLGSFDTCHQNIHKLVLFCHQHAINSAGDKLKTPLATH
ncbi:serine/arginine repetitive matrix protein 1-like [Sycon ciliatum]|uniref:serine/arginine repetitive matrix protein 1-like n=1 Tax=Sycon ciliatum TaxID=27933 RepID=UPI0031F66081